MRAESEGGAEVGCFPSPHRSAAFQSAGLLAGGGQDSRIEDTRPHDNRQHAGSSHPIMSSVFESVQDGSSSGPTSPSRAGIVATPSRRSGSSRTSHHVGLFYGLSLCIRPPASIVNKNLHKNRQAFLHTLFSTTFARTCCCGGSCGEECCSLNHLATSASGLAVKPSA